MSQFKGLIPAVFTPMKENGSINIKMIGPVTDYLIKKGVDGIYICGTTGEGVSLSGDERRMIAEAYINAVDRRIKVIVQVGHNSLTEANSLAKHSKAAGADAIAAIPPEYFKPQSVDDLVECMNKITDGLDGIPFFYYHLPSITGVNLDMVDFLKKAGERITGFEGIKYSSTSIHEYQACREYMNCMHTLLFGCDEMLLSALSVGARGAVGSTYNFAAPLYIKMIEAFDAGDIKKAREFQSYSVELVRLLARYDSRMLPALKGMMKIIGFDMGPPRLPFKAMSAQKLTAMESELKQSGFFDSGLV